MARCACLPAAVLLASAVLHPALAQETTATMYGVVTDQSGAAIPGARVTMTHLPTGISYSRYSSQSGEFAFDFLRIGRYTLRIEAAGFKTFQASGIELGAGQRARETFQLEIGQLSESVEVIAPPELLNTVSAEQRQSIERRQLADLPVAQRSLINLLQLGTGVGTTGGGSGGGAGVRLNGLGRSGARYTVDGGDASSNPENPATSLRGVSQAIHIISLEAIEEVHALKGIAPAEYGHMLGGSVNVVTKSGTNRWHGSLFHLFRAEDLDAKSRQLTTKPPLTFNQFGGSSGGPIRRDRIFIFGAFEGYREAAFAVVQGDVPTAKLRAEAIRAVPAYKALLDTIYLPNQPHAPEADSARYVGAAASRRRDNHAVIKGDWKISDATSLTLTYTRGRPWVSSPNNRISFVNPRLWIGTIERGAASFVAAGAAWTSELRFGYNYNEVERSDQYFKVGLDPSRPETIPGGRRLPTFNVSGIFSTGDASEVIDTFGSVWTLEEKYARHAGMHSFKFGGIFSRRGPSRSDLETPLLTYANKADFLANIPSQSQITFGVNPYQGRSFEFGFFAQDDIRLRSNLVVNAGLRYDFFSRFVASPKDPKAPAGLFNLDGLLNDRFQFGPFRDPNKPIEHDAGINLGPRLGFSYSPGAGGKTVIRGGAGVMFAPQPWDDYNRAVATSPKLPFRVRLSRSESLAMGIRYPVFMQDVQPLILALSQPQPGDVFDPRIQSPYSMNFYLGVQRAVAPTLMLETAFVGNRGVKFRLRRVYNEPDRVTDQRRNPSIGQGAYYCSGQNTVFTSWQTSLRKRFSRSLSFNAHYTWGKALSYTGGDTGANFSGDTVSGVQDFFNLRIERGPSTGDATHVLTGDFIYESPSLAAWGSRAARAALGNWQISGIVEARSGLAFDVSQSGLTTRPDYIGGDPVNRDFNRYGIYLNTAAFARIPLGRGGNPIRPGNLGRNALRGPAFRTVHLAVGKAFPLTEGFRLQMRADLFNALNYTPYTGVQTSINSAAFGRFVSMAASRQIQLNARLTW